jgi:DNA-binding NtrC family response regulator
MATILADTGTLKRNATRSAVLASADASFRDRVREALVGMRWRVIEAGGGAEALAYLDAEPAEAMILDSWLPDLEIREFVGEFRLRYPGVDLISVDEDASGLDQVRSPRRNELLYALRKGQDADGAIWNSAPVLNRQQVPPIRATENHPIAERPNEDSSCKIAARAADMATAETTPPEISQTGHPPLTLTPVSVPSQLRKCPNASLRLPELVGQDPAMIEVSRRIRLVAGRTTPVLIQGPTGTGKELVARALHRLSPRSARPFVALNCAAIPESLLESELFGHTRGAFTGAVQGRTGRIEAAHGGTLFLDEIGEMRYALQAKLLRFVECGELQRVGDNDTVRVDVRIVAATHRSLAKLAGEGTFRADLYYRLAVFLIRTPQLADHMSDLPELVDHFLSAAGREAPIKAISHIAMQKLQSYSWPGNVRELEHVLERASILAEERPEICGDEIEFGEAASAF